MSLSNTNLVHLAGSAALAVPAPPHLVLAADVGRVGRARRGRQRGHARTDLRRRRRHRPWPRPGAVTPHHPPSRACRIVCGDSLENHEWNVQGARRVGVAPPLFVWGLEAQMCSLRSLNPSARPDRERRTQGGLRGNRWRRRPRLVARARASAARAASAGAMTPASRDMARRGRAQRGARAGGRREGDDAIAMVIGDGHRDGDRHDGDVPSP